MTDIIDAFALGGRQGDPILALEVARQQVEAKIAALDDAGILDAETESGPHDRLIALEDQIAAATPTSIGGAIAVLGQLKRLGEVEWDAAHDKLVENLIAGLKRLDA